MDEKLFKEIREKQKKSLYKKYGVIIFLIFLFSIVLFFFIPEEQRNRNSSSSANEVRGTSTQQDEDTEVCISSSIDQALREELQTLQEEEIRITEDLGCTVHLTKKFTNTNDYDELWNSIYVMVVRADSVIGNVESNKIAQAIRSQNLEGYNVVWSKIDGKNINRFSNTNIISIYEDYSQLEEVIYKRKDAIAILPITQLTPKMKLLTIDGILPFDEDFYIYDYPLADNIWISSNDRDSTLRTEVIDIVENYRKDLQFDRAKYSTVVLTGHSAVGARQYFDLIKNPISEDVKELLLDADITHVSNENSFTSDCTQKSNSTILCSTPTKVSWLTDAGVDLVSLTGSGILDYGRPVFEDTLEIFNKNQIEYFAGGKDRDEARAPYINELNNSKFGFLGYSIITPTRYLATQNASGNTAPDKNRDGDALVMVESLAGLRNNSDVQIIEFQWGSDFGRELSLGERDYASIAVDNGADIVFGTTSHEPKKIEYKKDSVIFYGLGDFLYYHSGPQPHHGLIVENMFYDGRYIGFRAHPIVVNDQLQIVMADVDKSREILNTVLSNSFENN